MRHADALILVAFHFHTSDTESKVMWVFYTQIMTSLLAYFDDTVIAQQHEFIISLLIWVIKTQ